MTQAVNLGWLKFGLIALALSAGSPAHAAPGQTEINQTRALAGGVTPADTSGFPVTIATSGSYRLTSDLVVGGSSAENTVGILITADHVSLDLAGFSIRCEEPALPASIPCAGLGAVGDGIVLSGADNARIANGTIRDFARHGVHASQTSTDYQLIDLRVFNSRGHGVLSLANGMIWRSRFQDNGMYGIYVNAFSALILEVVTADNASGGIYDGNGTVSVGRSHILDGGTNFTSADLLECSLIALTRVCP